MVPTRSEQEIRSITALLALFGFILGFLLTLVGFKYTSSGAALFHKHHAIMLGLIIDLGSVCIQVKTKTEN